MTKFKEYDLVRRIGAKDTLYVIDSIGPSFHKLHNPNMVSYIVYCYALHSEDKSRLGISSSELELAIPAQFKEELEGLLK